MLKNYNFENEKTVVEFDKDIIDYLNEVCKELWEATNERCLSNLQFALEANELFGIDFKIISTPMNVNWTLFKVLFGDNNTFAYGSNFVNFDTTDELKYLVTKFFQEEKVKCTIENIVKIIVDGIAKQVAESEEKDG